jgi:hypothetical protein
MIERGHKPIVDGLAKITNGGLKKWVQNLHAILLADRCTTKSTTNQTPFRLQHGFHAVLPIELNFPTWRILDWDTVRTTSKLLALRTQQIQRRDEDLQEAIY